MNFKGKKRFSSFGGVFVSILVRISVLIFGITRLFSVISYNSEEIYESVSAMDPSQTVNFANMNNYLFLVGFNTLFPQTIGTVVVSLDNYLNNVLVSSQSIPVSPCDSTMPGTNATN